MIKTFFKKLFNKLTLRNYRDQLLQQQNSNRAELTRLYNQVFLNNPVLVMQHIKIYLPLFYVDHIQKTIYQTHNFYEAETLEFLKLHYKSFDHIVDIGSNIGNHILYYCSNLQAKKVYAFEPNQVNLETLRKNVALNYLDNTVTVYPVALGAANGKAVQSDFSLSNTGMNKVANITSDEHTGNTVEMNSLDHFNFKKIDFIKIDVEGFEAEVLQGAEQTIKRTKPVIMVEVFDSNHQQVEALLQSFGYRKFFTLEEYNNIYVPE